MLACGRRIVARSGVRGLTVRGVALQAKVNLGTFVYHFGTRDDFIAELMESWYAPLYAQLLDVTVDESLPPLQRLRRFMLRLAAFMADNRKFVRHLFLDAAGGEQQAIRFIRSMVGRHPLLGFRLVREAQAAGELRAGDPVKLGTVLFGATLFPTILLGLVMPDNLLAADIQPFLHDVFQPQAIEARLDLVLAGLAPVQRAGSRRAAAIPAKLPGKDKKMKKGKDMTSPRKSPRPRPETRP